MLAAAGAAIAPLPLRGRPVHAQTPAGQAQPAQPAAPPATRFEELRRGVGIFVGMGGTIGYLLTPDGALVVDAQYPQTADICLAGLRPRTPKGIDVLINTHHHADHTGGNIRFKPSVKRIVAHEKCVEWQRKVAEQAGNLADQAFAGETFTGAWQADIGGETVHARYFGPAHTSGDVVILFQNANVMHGGDLLWRRVHPRVDVAAGASVVNWLSTIEKMIAAHGGDTIFVFGHGKDNATRGTIDDVKYFRDYLSAAVAHAQKAVKAGQSKAEAASLKALPGFEDVTELTPRITLGLVIEAAYDELTK
jgi:glyoxylase-like metal-dependent hydrolase (beta-lactamase superfamily II)